MIIRRATAVDLSRVLEINQTFVPHVGPVGLEWFQKYLKLAALFDVVEIGGRVEAFVVGMLPGTDYASENFKWFETNHKNFIYVDRIAVSAEAQSQGIGKKIYDHIAEKCLNGHFSGALSGTSGANTSDLANNSPTAIACEVNVRPANPQSYAFHKKVGFEEVGQQETKGGTIRVAMLLKSL